MNTTRTTQGIPNPKPGNAGIPRRAKKQPALSELLLEARLASGLYIKEVAKESGVSVGSLSNLEQGKLRTTSIDRLVALADVYGIEPIALIEAAGYDLTPTLPTIHPYLRTKYRHLPNKARQEIADAFTRITQKYGIDEHASSPTPGQDEHPTPQNNNKENKDNEGKNQYKE